MVAAFSSYINACPLVKSPPMAYLPFIYFSSPSGVSSFLGAGSSSGISFGIRTVQNLHNSLSNWMVFIAFLWWRVSTFWQSGYHSSIYSARSWRSFFMDLIRFLSFCMEMSSISWISLRRLIRLVFWEKCKESISIAFLTSGSFLYNNKSSKIVI